MPQFIGSFYCWWISGISSYLLLHTMQPPTFLHAVFLCLCDVLFLCMYLEKELLDDWKRIHLASVDTANFPRVLQQSTFLIVCVSIPKCLCVAGLQKCNWFLNTNFVSCTVKLYAQLHSNGSLSFGLLLFLSGYLEDYRLGDSITNLKKKKRVQNNEIALLRIKDEDNFFSEAQKLKYTISKI